LGINRGIDRLPMARRDTSGSSRGTGCL
jgi:hypothetical protein